MAKLIWTDAALDWLREIGDFIGANNLDAAARVTEGVYQKSQILCEFPRSGWRHLDITKREVRVLLYGHYRIVYEIKDENCYVLAVVHAALDLDQIDL